jgi:predicted esterase
MLHYFMKGTLMAIVFLCFSRVNAQSGVDCVDYGTAPSGYTWNDVWNFRDMTQRKVTGLDIGGTGFFHGLLEHLPASYHLAANATKKYPVIIFFHGYASRGNGSTTELCRLFKDRGSDLATHLAIPGRVERHPELFSQTVGGVTYEYIVISPQFDEYTRLVEGKTDHFPSYNEVEDVIDYVEATYRIDPRRIYLTGLSNGANMITEYAASSLARAKRVAAIMPVSLCSELNHTNNTSRGIDATYIGQAKLKTWFVYCANDNCGITGQDHDVPVDWVNAIKAVEGHEPPRFTILKNANPPTLYNCSDTLTHDAWSRAFDPNFVASYVNGNGANDGVNQNVYEWFSEAQSAVLPVKLKDYSARLINGKVELKWLTTDEKDNASFTIERAGGDQHFVSIGALAGLKDHQGEQQYSFTDDKPLADVSYYRLLQTDIDGAKNYFDIKRIINQQYKGSGVIISPNPFRDHLSAFVTIDRAQKVLVSLTDITGKTLKMLNGVYAAGSTEIKIPATELPKGIYFLKVSGENFSILNKVVKK